MTHAAISANASARSGLDRSNIPGEFQFQQCYCVEPGCVVQYHWEEATSGLKKGCTKAWNRHVHALPQTLFEWEHPRAKSYVGRRENTLSYQELSFIPTLRPFPKQGNWKELKYSKLAWGSDRENTRESRNSRNKRQHSVRGGHCSWNIGPFLQPMSTSFSLLDPLR